MKIYFFHFEPPILMRQIPLKVEYYSPKPLHMQWMAITILAPEFTLEKMKMPGGD